MLPTLASLWLMPRLTEFTSSFKGIEVRIVTSIEPVDFALGNVDLAIGCGPLPGKRYDKGQPRAALSMVTDWEGVEARELFPDVLVPVLSRQLASQLAPISKPADLCRSRLIHTASRAMAWPDWLRAHDVDWRRSTDDIDFGHFFMSLQAAREGRGIAIIPSVLLQNYEGRSELLQPLQSNLPSAAEYYLLMHERTADEAPVRQLANWLMTQARSLPQWRLEHRGTYEQTARQAGPTGPAAGQARHLQCAAMRAVRAHRRITSWIAVLAILLGSFAPALSHALASATGTNWIEICTTQGSKWIQAGEDGSERAPASAHVLEHCPYCSLHASTLGVPPAEHLAHLPLRLSHEVPLAFLSAPRTLHAWVSAQPRAPPLFS